MPKQVVDVVGVPKGGPYSHAVIAGDFIFVSGQAGYVPGNENDFDSQFTNAINNISKILEAAGSSLKNVVKVTVYLSDRKYFERMNELFKKYFGENPPARTTIITGFINPNMLIEIDVIAIKEK